MSWPDLVYIWIREHTLRRYLLGRIGSPARRMVEKGYCLSAGVYRRLKLAEQDLVSEYVQGHLSRSEAESFEQHYLSSPRRKAYVSRAHSLQEEDPVTTRVAKSRRRFGLSIASSVAAVLLMVPIYWGAHGTETIQLQQRYELRNEGQRGQAALYRIGWMTRTLRIRFRPRNTNTRNYTVTLKKAGDNPEKSVLSDTPAEGLSLDVPVCRLSTGLFILTVHGLEETDKKSTEEEFRFELRIGAM